MFSSFLTTARVRLVQLWPAVEPAVVGLGVGFFLVGVHYALGGERSWAAAGTIVVASALAAAAAVLARAAIVPVREAVVALRRYAGGERRVRLDMQQGPPAIRALARLINVLIEHTEDRALQSAQVAEATGDVIWEWNAETQRVVWTGELRTLFGVASDRFEAGSGWWHARVHPQEREQVERHLAEVEAGAGRRWSAEYRFRHEDGTYRWFWDRGVITRDENGKPLRFVGCMTDISARCVAEERIWQLANHDELTGLPNRKVFHNQLNALAEASTPNAPTGMLLIDIDHFKDVNDSLGHPAGDALLKAVSGRLQAKVDERGTVFRLGGDEFGVLLPGGNRADSIAMAKEVLAALRDPIVVADRLINARATIGIAMLPEHGTDAATLLQNADLALYEGKSLGRNQAVCFEPSLRKALETRVTLLREVRGAIAEHRFAPHYQPIVSLKDGAVIGVEALMRWENEKRGLLAPASFLAAYDDPELALQLGTRLIECVLADYRIWNAAHVAPDYVAVNLSSAVARLPDLAERFLQQIAKGGMPPSRFCVELTETLLFGEHAELIGATVEKLHAAGVRIALDDFGTGYASLTHLQKFPVDAIKIDQSFVRSIATDTGSQAITSAVLELGRRLNMDVVAEGVETALQADILRAAGCRQAQGYHFARPMPPAALTDFMTARRDSTIAVLRAKAG